MPEVPVYGQERTSYMYTKIFFLVYIFAGFAGGLAILMAVLLNKVLVIGKQAAPRCDPQFHDMHGTDRRIVFLF